MKRACWGITRERPHSPGRVDDDAAIMRAVAAALGDHGLAVRLLPAEAAADAFAAPGAGIFAMCEQDAILTRLQQLVDSGVPVVNRPAAIRNTYRVATIARFARSGVPSPDSRAVSTLVPLAMPAPEVWVKRADFHATEASDVVFAGSPDAWQDTLAAFGRRGMAEVVVQRHVPGDLIKFYGVVGCDGAAPWFHWFYHKDQPLAGHAFATSRLHDAAFRAAAALEVEVFGGDAIVGADGMPLIIDLNAWPSFAVCRAEAAAAIARYLARAFASDRRHDARSRQPSRVSQ